MKKTNYLKEIQKRLPNEILVQDETDFEWSDDEYVSVLCWIKYFNEHYRIYGKAEWPFIQYPIISVRLRLDFTHYLTPNDSKTNFGKHIIYASPNGQLLNGNIQKNMNANYAINTWKL